MKIEAEEHFKINGFALLLQEGFEEKEIEENGIVIRK